MVISSNLQERIGLRICCLTLFTKIEIRSHTALVSYSCDRWSFTNVTNYISVYLWLLILGSLAKVINHKSLEGLRSVRGDLFINDFPKLIHEFAVQVAWAIAFSARKSFLVNFSAITFEANYSIIFFNGFFILFWSQNLTVYFLFDSFHFRLAAFGLSLDWAVTESFSHIFLDLRGHVLSVSNSTKLLFVSWDHLSVDSLVVKSNQVFHVSSSIVLDINWVITNCDWMRSLSKGWVITDILELITDSSWFHVEVKLNIWSLRHLEWNRWAHGEIWLYSLSSLFNVCLNE